MFDELFQIYLKNEEPVSRRAAWVAQVVTEHHPEWLKPWLDVMVSKLESFTHDGMKRESLRMIVRIPFPPENLGYLITICFNWLTSGKESVAVKMFSMEILYRISQRQPEIKQELADSIEWRMQEESPGFKAHGKKLLKQLYREIVGT